MDYTKIYEKIINKAKHRIKDTNEYYERHHIIPRCLGGNDSKDNLALLTAREHFIAHLCLVKIYPNNYKIILAATMMSCESPTHNRSRNKMYDWLRKRHSAATSALQTGEGNSQYGSVWVFNTELRKTKKIKISDLDKHITVGWQKGRIFNFDSAYQTCCVCHKKYRIQYEKKACSPKCRTAMAKENNKLKGRESEFLTLFKKTKSMNSALKQMGLLGAAGGYYIWAKAIILENPE